MNDRADALICEHTIILQTLIHLGNRKGLFTADEYRETHDWFQEKYKKIAEIASAAAYSDPPPASPSQEILTLIQELQKGPPCLSCKTTSVDPANSPSNSSTCPPTR